jgi:hypothetical protein
MSQVSNKSERKTHLKRIEEEWVPVPESLSLFWRINVVISSYLGLLLLILVREVEMEEAAKHSHSDGESEIESCWRREAGRGRENPS